MKNQELGEKIKALRLRNGLSQEELAERAQLSLRTIQRIESGETAPRGDTLIRLAAALKVDTEALTDTTLNEVEAEDRRFLALLNLSALSFIIFPLLGIIVPLILWILKRDEIEGVDETGKKILNFQVSWSIIRSIMIATLFRKFMFQVTVIPLFTTTPPQSNFFENSVIVLICAYAFNAFMIIYNVIRALNDQPVVYQPAFRLLK
ncbi:helix-turn-helix domain-containing protein [Pedobacter sp. MC2016-14]|uniref:helix-turn-helix domain-containing protein n=1 Tax=Pedobacter sp. MC2016-14 TaxID=2897327 RepID=UPI001E60D347|nr:helix-turn-helix domain-containing protein [Pedobacter sp. MC2016-14]MCD0490066.1 helix-turn-helix domain-containing protein [Pedobacter sp. MC2016-14]